MLTSCFGKEFDDKEEKKCEDDDENEDARDRGRVEDTEGFNINWKALFRLKLCN